MKRLSDADILIKEVAWVVLNHGYLSLGDMTLREFIERDLDLHDDRLLKVRDLLNDLFGGESK